MVEDEAGGAGSAGGAAADVATFGAAAAVAVGGEVGVAEAGEAVAVGWPVAGQARPVALRATTAAQVIPTNTGDATCETGAGHARRSARGAHIYTHGSIQEGYVRGAGVAVLWECSAARAAGVAWQADRTIGILRHRHADALLGAGPVCILEIASNAFSAGFGGEMARGTTIVAQGAGSLAEES